MPGEPPVKLYQVLPAELLAEAPLSVLLSHRQDHSFWEYPLAFLVALELPAEVADRFTYYSRGRCSS
jgi:hypothetical protein